MVEKKFTDTFVNAYMYTKHPPNDKPWSNSEQRELIKKRYNLKKMAIISNSLLAWNEQKKTE